MLTYYVSFGSNMGNRQAYIDTALQTLRTHPELSHFESSSCIETPPWGKVDQAPFLNGICSFKSNLEPQKVLDLLQDLERAAKRERLIHWGPRTLDLDIILVVKDDATLVHMKTERLTLPHPYFWDRTFVLEPLAELWPKFFYHHQSIYSRIEELVINEVVSRP